jgi:hypothetical protein
LELIQHPETSYTGLAAKKAMMIHDYWQTELGA